MDYAAFEKAKTVPASPVYAVTGDEPFLKRRAIDRIVRSLAKGPGSEYGVRAFDLEGPEEARPASAGHVLADLGTPSLFAPFSVVVVHRADGFLSRKEWCEALLEYLKAPAPGGALVLELKGLDGRTKAAKALEARGTVIECKKLFDRPPPWESGSPPHENPLARWIAAEGKAAGLKVALPVAQELAERVGNDLGSLSEELGKIALYVGAAPSKPLELTTKILSEAVGDYNEFGIFRLTDAVGARDLPGALRIARGLFEQGLPQAGGGAAATDETRVAAALADRIHAKVSEIFRARAVLDSGGSPDDVGKALGKNRFFVPVLVAEARRYPPAREGGALEALFEAESRVKSGGSGRHEIEVLLARVIGTGGKQAAT